MPEFVSGIELARAFYEEVIRGILGETTHAAARIGWGSDVLGFDTERSTDHGWGPRLQVFIAERDVEQVRQRVDAALPDEFRGWPTRFGWDAVPVTHHVEVDTLGDWLRRQLGFDPLAGVTTRHWLSTPQQILLEATAGAVYHDETGELTAARDALAWYPDEVWLWLLACQWRRLDQEEPFVGRTAEVGDELGSRILAARLVRDAIRLCFLLERRYAPYAKWLGSGFRTLDAARTLTEPMLAAVSALDAGRRESALVEVYEELAKCHNMLGLTIPCEPTVRLFHSRPYRVLGAQRFTDACLERVTDPLLRSLPLVGAIDHWVDSADVLSETPVFPPARMMYDAWWSN